MRDAGGDRDRDGQNIIGQQRGRGDHRRNVAQVIAGNDIGAASVRIGVDRLFIRNCQQRQQRDGQQLTLAIKNNIRITAMILPFKILSFIKITCYIENYSPLPPSDSEPPPLEELPPDSELPLPSVP